MRKPKPRQSDADSPLPLFVRVHSDTLSADELASLDYYSKYFYALNVRHRFRWKWSVGAQYLYRTLICALGLDQDESTLLRLAKPKPGRKQESALARRIYQLKAEGKNVPQIQRILENEGEFRSREAVASYLKTRRKQRKN
jgi:hypothetical protein